MDEHPGPVRGSVASCHALQPVRQTRRRPGAQALCALVPLHRIARAAPTGLQRAHLCGWLHRHGPNGSHIGAPPRHAEHGLLLCNRGRHERCYVPKRWRGSVSARSAQAQCCFACRNVPETSMCCTATPAAKPLRRCSWSERAAQPQPGRAIPRLATPASTRSRVKHRACETLMPWQLPSPRCLQGKQPPTRCSSSNTQPKAHHSWPRPPQPGLNPAPLRAGLHHPWQPACRTAET